MNRAEALALVTAPMAPGYARQIVRDTLKGWSADDVAAWHRLKDCERKAAKRDAVKDKAKAAAEAEAVRLAAQPQTGQVPVSTEGEDRTSSGSLHDDKPDPSPSPQVSPTPPSFPATTPTTAPAYVRPTVEQVIRFFQSSPLNTVPPDKQAEVAQAYLDNRMRTEPPWTLAATHDRPARPIGENWQADCRTFSRNWQEILSRNAVREAMRNRTFTNGKPRAEPDTTPLTVDATLWRRFATDPEHPEYRDLLNRPNPKTEADISPGVLPDWKNFKRRNPTRTNP